MKVPSISPPDALDSWFWTNKIPRISFRTLSSATPARISFWRAETRPLWHCPGSSGCWRGILMLRPSVWKKSIAFGMPGAEVHKKKRLVILSVTKSWAMSGIRSVKWIEGSVWMLMWSNYFVIDVVIDNGIIKTYLTVSKLNYSCRYSGQRDFLLRRAKGHALHSGGTHGVPAVIPLGTRRYQVRLVYLALIIITRSLYRLLPSIDKQSTYSGHSTPTTYGHMLDTASFFSTRYRQNWSIDIGMG